MKGLASLLTTDDGENQVLKRLQLVDTSRGLLNSIAIDSEGEQYDFKTFQFPVSRMSSTRPAICCPR